MPNIISIPDVDGPRRRQLMAAATVAMPARTPPTLPVRRGWREPAWWLFAVLITFGLVELSAIVGPAAVRHPAPLLFAAALFGLHGTFLIWILRRLDYLEPEPVALLATALAWGGIVATSNAVRANVAADSILTKLYPLTFVQRWGPAIEGPTNEDVLGGAGGGFGTVVSLLIKGGLILAALLVIIHFARQSEYRALASHLYRLDDVRVAPVGDVRALRTARTRRVARWNAYVSGGLAGTRAIRTLQRPQADLAGHLVRVDERPGTASIEYPGIARALAQISFARARLDPIEISESDTTRAYGTFVGWLAVLGGVATIVTPYALLVPIVLVVWRVRAARRARQYADPPLLTGLLIGVALLVVWLAFRAVGAVPID